MTQPTPTTKPTVSPDAAGNWIKKLGVYRTPKIERSVFELGVTLIPFALLWGAAIWSTSVSYWLTLPICILAAGFLVRLFLIQHDCSHGAFFKSKQMNNWVGRAIGVLTMTPYDTWQRSHLIHHSTHGNLDKRGIGDVETLTIEEYNARSYSGRLAYRLYRNPFVLFGIGPIFLFLLHHRLPIGLMRAGGRYWLSTMATNLSIAGLLIAGIWAIGWLPFLVIYLSITCTAAIIGVWLFYVQHQFEDTIWEDSKDWQLHEAALYGSSHYDLPVILRWMTANIGIHHVHHLYSRIPFYRLPAVLRDHPSLANIRRITLWGSFKTANLKLWDAQKRCLVSFKDARQRVLA